MDTSNVRASLADFVDYWDDNLLSQILTMTQTYSHGNGQGSPNTCSKEEVNMQVVLENKTYSGH